MYIYFVEYRVFVPFNKTERAKHKSTSCAPYEREKRASSKIITFCPVNLDKNNLRKQTSVHLLWGQTTVIVDEKGSTKIDSPEDDFIFYIINPKYTWEKNFRHRLL